MKNVRRLTGPAVLGISTLLALACESSSGGSDNAAGGQGAGGTPATAGDAGAGGSNSGGTGAAQSDAAQGDGGASARPDASVTPDAAPPVPDLALPTGLPLLGGGTHNADDVDLLVISDDADGLNAPRDLAFNPDDPDQLWVVNREDNSVVIYSKPGTADSRARKFDGPGNVHFLARPSSLAFGDNGLFATAQEADEMTQPNTPADFMGPTLWTADLSVFDAGHIGHYDMLHNSPNSAGIAWDSDNVYWLFDGMHQAISRYDFGRDHGPGGEDHSDGVVARYASGEVGYVENVPSHMEMDHATGFLYIADSGNSRIALLDTGFGRRGAAINPNYDGSDQFLMNNAIIRTVADSETGLSRPSGLALRDGILYVSDNETSRILAFDLEGTLLDWLDVSAHVSPGGLMALELDAEGRLYFIDGLANTITRVAAK